MCVAVSPGCTWRQTNCWATAGPDAVSSRNTHDSVRGNVFGTAVYPLEVGLEREVPDSATQDLYQQLAVELIAGSTDSFVSQRPGAGMLAAFHSSMSH